MRLRFEVQQVPASLEVWTQILGVFSPLFNLMAHKPRTTRQVFTETGMNRLQVQHLLICGGESGDSTSTNSPAQWALQCLLFGGSSKKRGEKSPMSHRVNAPNCTYTY